MNILYIDPVFGISGDMMISALIDTGLPFEELHKLLKNIPLPLPSMVPMKKRQGIIEGTYLKIEDSDTHLSISKMEELIKGLKVKERIKVDAKGMLDIILKAESKIHGTSRDKLHLHELSNIDTLIDLLCIAKGMDYFKIEKVYSGPIPLGRGTIKTSHGIIPNPAPATLEILSGYNVVFLDETFELTTPTGAAIVRYYVKDKNKRPVMKIEKTGYGLGTYKTDKPDTLRIFIGKDKEPQYDEELWVLEADMDDMEMEYIGAVAERIRNEGALDVLYFPVYMKKGRIGMRLSITVAEEKVQHLLDTLFAETTTFGIRMRKELRNILRREEGVVKTSYGSVRIKNGYDRQGKLIKTHIEFEDVKRIAEAKKIPYRVLLESIKKEVGSRK